MVIHFQTYSPDTCECVIEQQYDDEIEPREVTLAFFHKVCDKHKPLVKPVSKTEFDRKAKSVMDNINVALSTNRVKNLHTYDNHPHVKEVRRTINTLKFSKETEKHALLLEAQANSERDNIVRGLDGHENSAKAKIFNGLYSPDTFGTEDVYDTILEEQKKKNSGG